MVIFFVLEFAVPLSTASFVVVGVAVVASTLVV